jgi:peptide/nickel transport system substrate-binding protein
VASFFERFRISLNRRWKRGRRASGQSADRAHWDKNLIMSLSRARLPSWRQIRHLPEVLSTNDGARLKAGVFLILFGAAVLGVGFYFSHTHIVPAVGGSIVEGVVGTPRSLNPVLAVSNDVDMDLTRLMFSRLYTVDAVGAVVPDLVRDHELSTDGKVYTFRLRSDAKWHDGRNVTAEDVAYTVAVIQDPNWKSPLLPAFRDVTVERLADDQIRFTLKEPFAPFLSQLTFGILPQHAWKDIEPQFAFQSERNLKPIGSGPYMFSSFKRDKRGFILSYSVVRNADYYREAPFLEEISFRFYPDYQAAIDALGKREVDSLSFVPRNMRAAIKDFGHVRPTALELPQYTAVFFNPRKSEALKEAAVRRVLSAAIDKKRIVSEILEGEGRPLDGPTLPGYTDILSTASQTAAPSGVEELERLGWKIDPQDGIRKKTVKDPTVKCQKSNVKCQDEVLLPLRITLTTVDQPEALNVARAVKDGWTSIGAEVILNAVPAGDIGRVTIRTREYEALLYSQLLGSDPDPFPFWHSSQIQDPGLNLAMFANRAADDVIEAARKSSEPAVRAEHYKKFLGILTDELPAAFLFNPSYTYAVPAALNGFGGKRIVSPADRFATVTDWYLKTERAWR